MELGTDRLGSLLGRLVRSLEIGKDDERHMPLKLRARGGQRDFISGRVETVKGM